MHLTRILSFAGLAVAAVTLPASAQVFHFDTSADISAWFVYNISYLGQPLSNPVPDNQNITWDAANGLPAGSLRVDDEAGETWIGATTPVAGDKSALFGVGSISYDVYYRYEDDAVYAAVGLYGGGLTIYQPHDKPLLETWEHWDFPLVSGVWRVDSINGVVATDAQIQAVLANFQGIFIHTEWKTGPDDTNVDNISIGGCGAGGPGCCTGDINGDGKVDGADLGILLGHWGGSGAGDLNGSGTVDGADLGLLLGHWGAC